MAAHSQQTQANKEILHGAKTASILGVIDTPVFSSTHDSPTPHRRGTYTHQHPDAPPPAPRPPTLISHRGGRGW